jgi:hypothetical protein
MVHLGQPQYLIRINSSVRDVAKRKELRIKMERFLRGKTRYTREAVARSALVDMPVGLREYCEMVETIPMHF